MSISKAHCLDVTVTDQVAHPRAEQAHLEHTGPTSWCLLEVEEGAGCPPAWPLLHKRNRAMHSTWLEAKQPRDQAQLAAQ